MNKIEWNKVTWYSKAIAVILFLATFTIAFHLGKAWERAYPDTDSWSYNSGTMTGTDSGAPVAGPGEHCGGFIKNAPVCGSGYHCQLKVNMPDTGGTCVKNTGY